MSENNVSSNSISEINDGEDTMVVFSKEHTTSHYYNEVIEENNSERDAIKKVCNSFDAFCSHTTDVEYLIERYTELYNHNKVIKPMALSFITILLSVLANLCANIFTNMVNVSSSGNTVLGLLINIINPLTLVVALIISINMIFKEFRKTYSPYDIFILPYERERIRKELIARGYVPKMDD